MSLPDTQTVGHTPGPITVERGTSGFLLHSASVGGHYFGYIGSATQRDPNPVHAGGVSWEQAEANAMLWAAAPNLLAASKAALGLGVIPSTQPEYRMISAAIALAEGRTS